MSARERIRELNVRMAIWGIGRYAKSAGIENPLVTCLRLRTEIREQKQHNQVLEEAQIKLLELNNELNERMRYFTERVRALGIFDIEEMGTKH